MNAHCSWVPSRSFALPRLGLSGTHGGRCRRGGRVRYASLGHLWPWGVGGLGTGPPPAGVRPVSRLQYTQVLCLGGLPASRHVYGHPAFPAAAVHIAHPYRVLPFPRRVRRFPSLRLIINIHRLPSAAASFRSVHSHTARYTLRWGPQLSVAALLRATLTRNSSPPPRCACGVALLRAALRP